jgi:hypothetical protein
MRPYLKPADRQVGGMNPALRGAYRTWFFPRSGSRLRAEPEKMPLGVGRENLKPELVEDLHEVVNAERPLAAEPERDLFPVQAGELREPLPRHADLPHDPADLVGDGVEPPS